MARYKVTANISGLKAGSMIELERLTQQHQVFIKSGHLIEVDKNDQPVGNKTTPKTDS